MTTKGKQAQLEVRAPPKKQPVTPQKKGGQPPGKGGGSPNKFTGPPPPGTKKAQPKPRKKVLVAAPRQPRSVAVKAKPPKVGRGSGGVPRSPVTKGLSMPRKENAETMIQGRLKRKSPWYQSIIDPMHGADVKIPDSTGVETGTLQICQRVAVTSGATNSCAAVRTICLHPNKSGTELRSFNYMVANEAPSGEPDFTPLEDEADYISFDDMSVLQEYAQGVRVVSAAVYCQSFASLATNQGVMTTYCRPYPVSLEPGTTTITDFQNMYKSTMIPVNNNAPAVVRWYPVKTLGGMYDMFYGPTQGAGAGFESDGPENPFWEMGIIVSGIPAGIQYEFTIIVNYEFIPLYNALNILDLKPSPVDAQETDLVENWVQDMPVGQMTTTTKVSKPPSASEVEEPGGGTGFGMFAEVLSAVVPFLGLL
jgi:hypothetical protein